MITTKTTIGKSKVSQVLPAMKVAAHLYGLKLNRARDFKTAKRVLVNSVKFN